MSPNLTGYCQPCDMGLFATVKKRFRSYRRTTMVEKGKSPLLKDTVRNVVKIMTELTPAMVRCFWKVSGLIDANDSDDARLGQIIETEQEMLEDELCHENSDEETEEDEEEREAESEDVQLVQDGINEIQISNDANRQKYLKQSQITNFFQKN